MEINELLIGNIAMDMSEAQIRSLFSKTAGVVKSISIPLHRKTGTNLGYALVQMVTADGAHQAVNDLNGFNLDGRQMAVSIRQVAKEKKKGWFQFGS